MSPREEDDTEEVSSTEQQQQQQQQSQTADNGNKKKNDDDDDDNINNNNPWSDSKVQFIIKYWELSEMETTQFAELQQRLSDIDHWKYTPDVVVRFLRARPNDIDAAEQLFRDMIAWRQKTNADTILEDYDPPLLFKTKFPSAILQGVDKDGDPIFVSRMGQTDSRGFLKRYGAKEMIRHAIWLRELTTRGEWIVEYEKMAGRPVKRCTIIEDLTGLSFMPSREELSTFNQIMRLDQDNYCETAKKLIVLRVPFFFRAIWAIIKHFFDPGVVDKMVFLSGDYLPALDEYVDRTVLPPCLCPDEGKGTVAIGFVEGNLEGGKLSEEKDEEEDE